MRLVSRPTFDAGTATVAGARRTAAMNNRGQVVGRYDTAVTSHAVVRTITWQVDEDD
jgi:hypothetical protein